MIDRIGNTVVKVHNLRMRYGSNDVLDGVEFDIRRGEVVTLLGPNEAGKTTTIEILEGFQTQIRGRRVGPRGRSTSGRRRLEGAGRSSAPSPGVTTPAGRPDCSSTIWAATTRPPSTSERERPYDVDQLIKLVGIKEQADQKIRTLSGGERRRLDVAVGIIRAP